MTTSLSTSTTRVDHRRMDERDADYQRLHAATAAKLWQALRRYAQALAASARMAPQMGAAVVAEAQSAFIRQQVETLRSAYLAAHWEGERDYWGAHTQPGGSAAATRQRHLTLSRAYGVAPNLARLQRTLAFYAAASVTKMAREGLAALHASQAASQAATRAAEPVGGGGTILLAGGGLPPQLAQWLDGLTARVGGQAEIVWPGLQDGYAAAGSIDPANPYAYVWWVPEPTAAHCVDCPVMAAASPYSAPGSGGMFGNELWVTPGDGTTACGGGCKCTLQWTPPDDQALPGPTSGGPAGGGPGDAPGDTSGGEDAMATTATKADAGASGARVETPPWTTAQVTALDQMRAALIAWDRVRGGGPRFNVFAPDDSDLTQAQQIGTLTVAQARALARFAAARQAYRAAVLQAIPAAHASLTKGAFAE